MEFYLNKPRIYGTFIPFSTLKRIIGIKKTPRNAKGNQLNEKEGMKMGHAEEIDKAIGAHGAWKQRLKMAIETGNSEFTTQQVRVDDRCVFGQWLYNLPASIKTNDHWKNIQRLHAEFHAEAAHVLTIALSGKKEEALILLEPGGKYTLLTGQLGIALTKWKAQFG